jgi:Chaperone of endosialidase
MRISPNKVRKDYRAGTLLQVTFACSFFFASVVTLAVTPTESPFGAAFSTKPDALLQIDLNRSSIVEKIVSAWEKEIPAAQIDSFRSKLSALRADQLLAANVSGSFDGVLEVVNRQELTLLVRNEVSERSKALGDATQDLVYTPITPCRIADTRSASAAGIPNPMLGNVAHGIKSFSSAGFASYGGSGTPCNIPATGEVRAIVANVIGLQQAGLPNFTAFVSVGDSNVLATLLSNAALNFNALQGANATVVIPTNASGNLYMAMPTGLRGNFIVEVSGYFLPIKSGNVTNSVSGGDVFVVTNTNPGSGSTAVHGASTSTGPGGIGVWGSHLGGGFGVYGTAGVNGYGVYAAAGANGFGVYASAPSGNGAAVFADGDVKIAPAGNLSFGSQVRQMINLWGPNIYGIGVQAGTQYFRTDSNLASVGTGGFAWYEGGVHSDAAFDAGVGGSSLLRLTRAKELVFGDPISTQNGEFLKLNAIDRRTIGSQGSTLYFRSNSNFCWHINGVHSDTACDPGTGGTTAMRLTSSGLTVNGTFVSASDRNKKEQFSAVNPKEMLKRVAALPISSWVYKNDNQTRHIGPVAQDFKRLFGVGQDDKTISMVDADGVAFAAIQGLNLVVKEKEARIEKLERELAAIKKKLGL